MDQRTCATCGGVLRANDNGANCSRCKYAKRPRIPCADCGGPTGWPLTDKRAPAFSRCRACQRARPAITHGKASGYGNGCRCRDCTTAHADNHREYAALVRERDGVSLSEKYGRPEHRSGWISPASRLAIYERDGWVCQLCYEPVDRDVLNGRLAPSLDHIIPRSHVLIPDDSPSNLRTAHMGCNAQRGNRVATQDSLGRKPTRDARKAA